MLCTKSPTSKLRRGQTKAQVSTTAVLYNTVQSVQCSLGLGEIINVKIETLLLGNGCKV